MNLTDTAFDRLKELEKAKEESELSDLKQHAMKMIRDFEKFNQNSSNRAIWELVQNACDLSTKCEITIDYRNDRFAFTHNGKPFTSNSLVSLIKQVSGDKDESSDIPPIGKYGTGFLTTHSLGRLFTIDSYLQTSGGYLQIKDFEVDRRGKSWEAIAKNIRRHKEKVFEIIENGVVVAVNDFKTVLTYIPDTDQEKIYIKKSLENLNDYVPLVITINDRIKSIEIITSEGDSSIYKRVSKQPVENDSEIKLYKTVIEKAGETIEYFSINDFENEIEVILPIAKDNSLFTFKENIARLFLYYPLLGTEDFGINFIINSKKFLPTEPRDGIHLKSDKDQIKDDEEMNRSLILKASDLIFQFLNSGLLVPPNPLLYADINFKRESDDLLSNEYFNELQNYWTRQFKSLKLVDTALGFQSVSDTFFLSPELLSLDFLDSIYYLASKFYDSIPGKDTVTDWSKFVHNWDYEDVKLITVGEIAKKIAPCSLTDFDTDLLHTFYRFLVAEKHHELFSGLTLLPNVYGEFRLLSELKRPVNLSPLFYNLGQDIIPKTIEELVLDSFQMNFAFPKFDKFDFLNAVDIKLNSFSSEDICLPELYDEGNYTFLDPNTLPNISLTLFKSLINLSKITTNLDSQSKPLSLMKLVSRYYNLTEDLLKVEFLPGEPKEFNLRPIQKVVARIFINTIALHNKEWVETNIADLYDLLSYHDDRYKDVYLTAKIYPDQLFNLKRITELKKDVGVFPEMKKLYLAVTQNPIEAELGHINFNSFLKENEEVDNQNIATELEAIFFGQSINTINEHPFKEQIIDIISHIKEPYYSGLFHRLDANKATIMLDVLQNENTKEDIFAIVMLNETQLNQLGQLVQLPNFDHILIKAQENIKNEKEHNSNFQHKKEIGLYIENKIHERLNVALASKLKVELVETVRADNIQGGQDIIISFEGTPIYYIEVKSRWDSNNSVYMSKLQLERASQNIDRYSLISVDVTKYNGSSDKYKLSLEEILPLTKVVNGIGGYVEPLVANNILAEHNEDYNVRLVDYRGLINQDTIKAGESFETFLDTLITDIHLKLNI